MTAHNDDFPANPAFAEAAATKLGSPPACYDVLGLFPQSSPWENLDRLGLLRESADESFDEAADRLGERLARKAVTGFGPEICAAVRRQQALEVAADKLPDGAEHDAATCDANLGFGSIALMPAADAQGAAAKLALLMRDMIKHGMHEDQYLDLLASAIADLLRLAGIAPLAFPPGDQAEGGAA